MYTVVLHTARVLNCKHGANSTYDCKQDGSNFTKLKCLQASKWTVDKQMHEKQHRRRPTLIYLGEQ